MVTFDQLNAFFKKKKVVSIQTKLSYWLLLYTLYCLFTYFYHTHTKWHTEQSIIIYYPNIHDIIIILATSTVYTVTNCWRKQLYSIKSGEQHDVI